MASETAPQSSPLLKSLASSNAQTRRDALEKLQQYLRGHGTFTQLDLLKLWKGLYYCMWMSDRPKAQQQLARDLAGLVRVIREENVLGWLEAFWTTIAREWKNIDALRMNKFLYLVRQYLYATFQHLARSSWSDEDTIDNHVSILSSIPLNPTDDKIPNGLRYHLLDIYVDELDRVDPNREGHMPVETLLQPVETLSLNTPYKVVRTRAEEALSDERLKDWQARGANTKKERGVDDEVSHGVVVDHNDTSRNNGLDEDDEWEGIDDS